MEKVSISPRTILEAVNVLKKGGVIVHPADTCFGLAADFMNPDAVKRVQAIKGRYGAKPMSIMLPAITMLDLTAYARLDGFTRNICNQLFPGPVTILLPKGPSIPEWYFPETDLIGIRVPYDPFTQDLLNAFKGPLVTTSANTSGCQICHTHEMVLSCFKSQKEKPDLIFEGALPKNSLASTVIFPEKGKIKIIRQGPLTASQLKNILGIAVIG